jgi:hypothetical protein
MVLAALITPPKLFYRVQSKIAGTRLYQHVRQRLLPNPRMTHLQRDRLTNRIKLS